MSKTALVYMRAGLALVALLGFIYLYGRAMIDTVRSAQPAYSDAYIYLATTLAGLVGGVGATGLGQNAYAMRANRARSVWSGLGQWLAPFSTETLQETLAMAYTVVYTIFGIAALVVWAAAKPDQPVLPMIRDLGLIFLGLVVATAQSFLGPPVVIQARGNGRPKRH